jgi:formiminotetrahydrofolate cyclodeaminase
MVEDQEAYTALTDARKQGGGEAFDVALLASIRVPQAIATTALALLEISDKLVDKVNHHLLSDLAVCTDLAVATIRCASYNIRANLPDVADLAERKRFEQSAAQLVRRGIALVNQISPRIWKQGASAS